MADLAFLQAIRDTLARSTTGTPNPAVVQNLGLGGGPTTHEWQPVSPSGTTRSFEPLPAGPPSPAPTPSGGGLSGALSAGDALFHRLGPAFDPIMSGMRSAFGLGQPITNQTPAPPILSQTQPMNPADAPWYTPPDPNTRSLGPWAPSGIGAFGNFPQPRPWQ